MAKVILETGNSSRKELISLHKNLQKQTPVAISSCTGNLGRFFHLRRVIFLVLLGRKILRAIKFPVR